MLKLFLFHLITFTGLQLHSQERVQVSPEASIEFPCSPKIETQNIITTSTCRSSNTIYQVLLLDFSTVDGFVIGADDIDEFYRGYIDGQSEKSGSVITNERTIMVDGHEGREFSMIIHIENHELIAHNRVVLHEKICYALVCAVPTKNKRKFSRLSKEFFDTFDFN